MAGPALLAAIVAGAGIVACAGTRGLIPLLRRRLLLDHPNERSLHAVPTPRGGGIAVVAAILLAWLLLIAVGAEPPLLLAVCFSAVLLAIVSWVDDVRPLSPATRLGPQFGAVGIGLLALMPGSMGFHGWLPPVLAATAAALLWLWFVNLFNFMDGMDGLAGSEAATIGIGLMLFALFGIGRD